MNVNSISGEDMDNIINKEGLLNVMKTNVAERRRVQKQNPAFREVSMFVFTQDNPYVGIYCCSLNL